MTTTVLISGGNRGLGLGLVQGYASRPGYTVISAVRNPASMPDVKTAEGSRVVVVKIDAGVGDDAEKGLKQAESDFGIKQVDIVVANAAIGDCFFPLAKVPLDTFEDHWRINVLGALALFQVCIPRMKKGGKFIFMSSGASPIDRVPDKEDAGYGITKSSCNYLARYAHFENPDLVVFSLSPGWVQTDMGDRAAIRYGAEKAPITVEESVAGMLRVIDDSSREKWSGLHARYDGTQSKW